MFKFFIGKTEKWAKDKKCFPPNFSSPPPPPGLNISNPNTPTHTLPQNYSHRQSCQMLGQPSFQNSRSHFKKHKAHTQFAIQRKGDFRGIQGKTLQFVIGTVNAVYLQLHNLPAPAQLCSAWSSCKDRWLWIEKTLKHTIKDWVIGTGNRHAAMYYNSSKTELDMNDGKCVTFSAYRIESCKFIPNTALKYTQHFLIKNVAFVQNQLTKPRSSSTPYTHIIRLQQGIHLYRRITYGPISP